MEEISDDWEVVQNNQDDTISNKTSDESSVNSIEDCERVGSLNKEAKRRKDASDKKFPTDIKREPILVDVTKSSDFSVDEIDRNIKQSYYISPYAAELLEIIRKINSTSTINCGLIFIPSATDKIKDMLEDKCNIVSKLSKLANDINASSGKVIIKQPTLNIVMDTVDSEKTTLYIKSSDLTVITNYSETFKFKNPSYIIELMILQYFLDSTDLCSDIVKGHCKVRIDKFISQLDLFIENFNSRPEEEQAFLTTIAFNYIASESKKTRVVSGTHTSSYLSEYAPYNVDINIGEDFIVHHSFKIELKSKVEKRKENKNKWNKEHDKRRRHDGAGTGIFSK